MSSVVGTMKAVNEHIGAGVHHTTMAVTGAGLEGIVATDSAICFIDGDLGILSYQGYDIHTLADHATFEEVIFLLCNCRLPNQQELDALKAALVNYRSIDKNVAGFVGLASNANPIDILRTAGSILSLYDPHAKDMSPAANHDKTI